MWLADSPLALWFTWCENVVVKAQTCICHLNICSDPKSVTVATLWTVGSTTTRFYTFEEAKPGTVIGNLSLDLKIHTSYYPNTSFRFMQEGNSSLINIQKNGGLLTVGERIDRESLCQRSPVCLITFDVVVVSKDKFDLIHVEIQVRDINDHSPQFTHIEMQLEIAEDVAVGTRFPLDVANDLDIGHNYIQSYHLFQNSHFSIETRSGEEGIKYPQLVLVKELDREVEDAFTLQVTASDGGDPPKLGMLIVKVNVLDSNDNSPQFELDSLKFELHEDAPAGYLLFKLHAVDPDSGINSDVRYDFVEGVVNELKDSFSIDPLSGAVTLKSQVDYETRKSIELNVQAYDLGVDSIPSICRVTVEIMDVNDNAPEISITPMTSTSEGIAYITEAAAAESFVALISTTDKDSGVNGQVHLSLNGHEHFKLQQAYGDTFMIITTATLDREKIPEYNLTVTAEDLGSPPFSISRQYTIRVSDENDNPPLFSKSVYELSVMENKEPGSYIGTLVARDPDAVANGKVTYKMIDTEIAGAPLSTLVSLDSVSGTLFLVKSLDYEHLKQIEVSIEATDGGSPKLSSSALIKVKIVDKNDNAPVITHPDLVNDSAHVSLPYNTPAGYVALKVKAHDMDDGVNSKLSFSLLEDKTRMFLINRNTGDIVLKHILSYKRGDFLEIKVMVTDGGRIPFSCTANIRFVVTEEQPVEEQVVVSIEMTGVEESEEQQRTDLKAPLIVILLLGAGCMLLLVAILAVALSHRPSQRNPNFGKENPNSESFFANAPDSMDTFDLSDSSRCHESGDTVSEQISSIREDSSYEEQSQDSDSKMFHPLLKKPIVYPITIWQGQMSSIVSTDETSTKDSGKGDGDFIDCNSDIGGDTGKNISAVGHQQTSNSTCSVSMGGLCRKTREISTNVSSTPVGGSGYKIAYHTSTFGHHSANVSSSLRHYGYTFHPITSEQRQVPVCHRIKSHPSQVYQHHNEPCSHLERRAQLTVEDLAEVITAT
ncbi:protocadherin-8-like [Xyrauchen texanus]|uniref:protocadherin-8-like n=1 Tax=Xyrauchen texanus TaxID=154827 RepID=UPI0022418B9C|nr:protocadherin-8-like [Xyrauchen texanus]